MSSEPEAKDRDLAPPESAVSARESTTGEDIAALQNEVVAAVRGAITGVMGKRVPDLDLNSLDLDFAVPPPAPAPPALRAEPTHALVPPSRPEVPLAPLGRRRSTLWAASAGGVVALACGASVLALSRGWISLGTALVQPAIIVASAPSPPLSPQSASAPAPASPAPQGAGTVSTAGKTVRQVQAVASLAPVEASAPPRPQAPAAVKPQPEPLTPGKPPALPPAAVTAAPPDALVRARSALQAGHVKEARALLAAGVADAHSEAAFVYARSFDPGFLGTLAGSDAAPDVVEAARWYRRWYELAQKEGAVTTMRLDLLLRSLGQAVKQP